MGRELRDRTLGVIGLGGIARKLLELLAGWGMKPPIAFDPFVDPAVAAKLGVRLVELDELLRTSDFVSIHCPLTDKTRGLIGRRELALMKPDAYLINTARGGIVDEDALYDALKQRRIAGAALDCFATEPLVEPYRFGDLENVLLAPHSIAWTNEMFRDIGRTACQGMVDLSLKRRPRGIVNPEVLEQPGFQRKWERLVPIYARCDSVRTMSHTTSQPGGMDQRRRLRHRRSGRPAVCAGRGGGRARRCAGSTRQGARRGNPRGRRPGHVYRVRRGPRGSTCESRSTKPFASSAGFRSSSIAPASFR